MAMVDVGGNVDLRDGGTVLGLLQRGTSLRSIEWLAYMIWEMLKDKLDVRAS